MARGRTKVVGVVIAGAIALLPVCARNEKAASAPTAPASSFAMSASRLISVSVAGSASASVVRDVTVYAFGKERGSTLQAFAKVLGEEQRVLDLVIGKANYLGRDEVCKQNGRPCHPLVGAAQMRQAGRVHPVLDASAEGAFTKPDAHETLWAIRNNECFVGDEWTTTTFAVFDGTSITRREVFHDGYVVAAIDINGDGQLEFAHVGAYHVEWIRQELLRLLRFTDSGLEIVKDFGAVFDDRCEGRSFGYKEDEVAITLSTVHWITRADGTYDFRVDKTTKPCPPIK
jgi:hypothetical protein